MYKLFFGNVEPYYDEKNFEDGYKKVCTYRKNKIDALKIQEEKARSLTAGLLFEEACKTFGLEMLLVKLNDDEHGKPFFDCPDDLFPGGKPMYFNISHSKNYVMVGISDGPIGVDIQYMEPLKSDIASRFFHPDEQDLYMKASDEEYLETFFRIWCLKESYVKFLGTGLSEGLETFSVINHMQDCGKWKDDYIYSVTTVDYKAQDEALKAEEEAKKAEIQEDILGVIKEAATNDAKEGRLVGKVVSSNVIKKEEEKAPERKKLEPVKTTIIRSEINKAVETVKNVVEKVTDTVKSEVTKVVDAVKEEAKEETIAKTEPVVKEAPVAEPRKVEKIQQVPEKTRTLYQNMVAGDDEEAVCFRKSVAHHKMSMRRNTKYFRLK